MDDLQLVERFQAGEVSVFSELFERYRTDVEAWCLSMLKNESVSEEVAQDVWLTLFQYLPIFRKDCAFKTLLYQTTKSRVFMWLRDQKTPEESFAPSDLENLPIASGESPDTDLMVNDMLKNLDTDERILILAKIEGYTDEELADKTGSSLAAVKTRLHRTRQKLKEEYA